MRKARMVASFTFNLAMGLAFAVFSATTHGVDFALRVFFSVAFFLVGAWDVYFACVSWNDDF